MEDIYVVSAGARERLLAVAEPREEYYVVRAGLDPDLLRSHAVGAHRATDERPTRAFDVRIAAAATSLGRK
jgi:hypothetical protein